MKFVPVIVTAVAGAPLVGVKLEIEGSVTVKLPVDVAVPPEVVTATLPVVDPLATVAVIWVALSTEKVPAAFPLNFTAVAPVRFVPVTVTAVPEGPEAGAKPEMVGAAGGGLPLPSGLPRGAEQSWSALSANPAQG